MKPKNAFIFAAATALGVLLALSLIAPRPALAQGGANTGLSGTVSDPTGLPIPGATVTITRVDTGEQRVVTSNDSGDWEARYLAPGAYQLLFELDGFKKLTQTGVNVTSAEIGTVNVALEIGALIETVEVIAGAEMVSTNSSTIVNSLNQRELEALPTSSRNFTQLLVIEPGVSADISDLLSK